MRTTSGYRPEAGLATVESQINEEMLLASVGSLIDMADRYVEHTE
jgi:hypothetical protein